MALGPDGKVIVKEYKELVTHPVHYNKGEREVIEIIRDQCRVVDGYRGFLMGNVIKYVCRHPHKKTPGLDLEKAEFYLNRLIDEYGRTPKTT